MKIAIMQPYIFPYIGYYQLVKLVDQFVFLNDVNYIKKGWVNRNQILVNGKPHVFTIPLNKASPFKKINDLFVSEKDLKWRMKLFKTLEVTYHNAPNFSCIMDLIESVLNSNNLTIDSMAQKSITKVMEYLGNEVKIQSSSDFSSIYTGQQRIIDICERLGASEYINLPGGRFLYSGDSFKSKNISLNFIHPKFERYHQNSNDFHQGLSIIDMLMCLDKQEVNKHLNLFELEEI